ncbi:hypothetical protein [Streptomyces brasiliscabiei]|uniref:hypothetical protein n=1 Tax=Streptomyces brasiliscabiei TaxID=2736302 RepID=UPI0038F5FEFD
MLIKVGRTLSSVAWELIGRKVGVRSSATMVQVCHEGRPVKTHTALGQGKHTDKSDCPPEEIAFRMRTPVRCRSQAFEVGDACRKVVDQLTEVDVLHRLRAAHDVLLILADRAASPVRRRSVRGPDRPQWYQPGTRRPAPPPDADPSPGPRPPEPCPVLPAAAVRSPVGAVSPAPCRGAAGPPPPRRRRPRRRRWRVPCRVRGIAPRTVLLQPPAPAPGVPPRGCETRRPARSASRGRRARAGPPVRRRRRGPPPRPDGRDRTPRGRRPSRRRPGPRRSHECAARPAAARRRVRRLPGSAAPPPPSGREAPGSGRGSAGWRHGHRRRGRPAPWPGLRMPGEPRPRRGGRVRRSRCPPGDRRGSPTRRRAGAHGHRGTGWTAGGSGRPPGRPRRWRRRTRPVPRGTRLGPAGRRRTRPHGPTPSAREVPRRWRRIRRSPQRRPRPVRGWTGGGRIR